jgi:hypothetical protein
MDFHLIERSVFENAFLTCKDKGSISYILIERNVPFIYHVFILSRDLVNPDLEYFDPVVARPPDGMRCLHIAAGYLVEAHILFHCLSQQTVDFRIHESVTGPSPVVRPRHNTRYLGLLETPNLIWLRGLDMGVNGI